MFWNETATVYSMLRWYCSVSTRSTWRNHEFEHLLLFGSFRTDFYQNVEEENEAPFPWSKCCQHMAVHASHLPGTATRGELICRVLITFLEQIQQGWDEDQGRCRATRGPCYKYIKQDNSRPRYRAATLLCRLGWKDCVDETGTSVLQDWRILIKLWSLVVYGVNRQIRQTGRGRD